MQGQVVNRMSNAINQMSTDDLQAYKQLLPIFLLVWLSEFTKDQINVVSMQLPPVVPHGLPVIAVVDAVLDSGTNNTFVLSVGLHIMVHTVTYRLRQGETFDAFFGEI